MHPRAQISAARKRLFLKMAKGFISLNMAGWQDLAKSLEELGSDKDIVATERKALIEVATPAAEYARGIARRKSGKMARSINVSTQLTKAQRRYKIKVGPLEAAVYFGPSTSNAHLIEFGTKERHWTGGKNRSKRVRESLQKVAGKSTGAGRPFPFMRPAWEFFKTKMITEFGRILGAQIEKSAKRIARRQAKLIAQGKK